MGLCKDVFGVRFSKEEKTWIRRVAVMRGCLYTFSKEDFMKWVLEAKIYSHQNGDEFFHYSDDLTVQAQTSYLISCPGNGPIALMESNEMRNLFFPFI